MEILAQMGGADLELRYNDGSGETVIRVKRPSWDELKPLADEYAAEARKRLENADEETLTSLVSKVARWQPRGKGSKKAGILFASGGSAGRTDARLELQERGGSPDLVISAQHVISQITKMEWL